MENIEEQYQELKEKHKSALKRLRKYEVGNEFCHNKEDLDIRLSNMGILDFFNGSSKSLKFNIVYISGITRFPRLTIRKESSEKIRLMSRLLSVYEFFSKLGYDEKYVGLPENFMTFNFMEIFNDCSKLGVKIDSENACKILHNIYYLHSFLWSIPRWEEREVPSGERTTTQSFEVNQSEILNCKKKIFEQTNSLKSYILNSYNSLMDENKGAIKKVEIKPEEILDKSNSKFDRSKIMEKKTKPKA